MKDMQDVLKKAICVFCCALLVLSLRPVWFGCGGAEEIRF